MSTKNRKKLTKQNLTETVLAQSQHQRFIFHKRSNAELGDDVRTLARGGMPILPAFAKKLHSDEAIERGFQKSLAALHGQLTRA